ncbi:hypothetical protein V2J09_009556 [Rumex salicifolius]
MLANTAPQPPSAAPTQSDDNPEAAAQQRPALRCPRCDSSNTKFCYYNNYSLSQPRHFCKSCRRYWTHGGALRNVPVGGASRKSKKPRRSSIPSPIGPAALLGGGSGSLIPSFPPLNNRLNNNNNYPTNLSPFGDLNLNPPLPLPPQPNFLGLSNYPLISTTNDGGGGGGGGGLMASSIESLSSLNQELHWKLQQQRMSMLLDDAVGGAVADKKPQPIFFQNLDATNSYASHHSTAGTHQEQRDSPNSNQWFFDTTYGGGGESGNGSGSGIRNNNCGERNEINNEGDHENIASRMNNAGGYVLDKDGVIKFQQYAQWLGC